MTSNKRQNNASSYAQSASSRLGVAPLLNESKEVVKNNASLLAGVFCLIAILVVVGLWQLIGASGKSKADALSSPDVINGVGVNNNVDNQSGISSDGSNGGVDVSIHKDSDGPAKVTINGQPVPVPQNGTVHANDSDQSSSSSVQVNVNNGLSTGSGGSSHVYSHSSTFTHSNSQTSNINFRSTTSN